MLMMRQISLSSIIFGPSHVITLAAMCETLLFAVNQCFLILYQYIYFIQQVIFTSSQVFFLALWRLLFAHEGLLHKRFADPLPLSFPGPRKRFSESTCSLYPHCAVLELSLIQEIN